VDKDEKKVEEDATTIAVVAPSTTPGNRRLRLR
jgi:hypothetical protein